MKSLLIALLLVVGTAVHAAEKSATTPPKPTRVNKAIELLAAGQPVYYDYGRGGAEEGKLAAAGWADLLMYDMEGAALDFTRLRAFMKALADAGPTASGHRTPAVIVTLPLYGLDAVTVQANHWMIQQALAAGVHGLHICHARNPAAVAMFIRAARYEIHKQAVGAGLRQPHEQAKAGDPGDLALEFRAHPVGQESGHIAVGGVALGGHGPALRVADLLGGVLQLGDVVV